MKDIDLAKLAILDAYIALLDAVVYCSNVKALSPLGKSLEPITHELNVLMTTMYSEPFASALKRASKPKPTKGMALKRKTPKQALKRK